MYCWKPASADIVQSEVVGPSLGQEAIDNGTNSAIVGLLLVSLWMMVYYGKAGWYANIALAVNLLFLWNFGKFRCSSYIAWYSRYRFDDGYSSGCYII
jgi:preprotein translocase subunit SecD